MPPNDVSQPEETLGSRLRDLERRVSCHDDDIAWIDKRLRQQIGRETGGMKKVKPQYPDKDDESPQTNLDINEAIRQGLPIEVPYDRQQSRYSP